MKKGDGHEEIFRSSTRNHGSWMPWPAKSHAAKTAAGGTLNILCTVN